VDAKKLYRNRPNHDRMIAGVCGGLGQFFNIDPTIIRLIFALAALAGLASVPVYLILWVVVPLEPEVQL
jgi:phage shock protein C